MTNKVKIIALAALLGSSVAVIWAVVHAATGGRWLVSVPIAVIGAFVARAVYWRTVMVVMTNAADVVATDHGPRGRVDAIEVFWRPG